MKSAKVMGRPVGSSRDASLARLLAAAKQAFASKGYDKTTFKNIGAEIGMTSAALYGYFPSKAALYQACCEHAQASLLPAYQEAVQRELTLRSQLREILQLAAKADKSTAALLAAMPLEISRHAELAVLLNDRQNATFQFLVNIFEAAQRRGEISKSAKAEDQLIAMLGAAVGIAMFQSGIKRGSLIDSMQVFVDLIEAKLFLQ